MKRNKYTYIIIILSLVLLVLTAIFFIFFIKREINKSINDSYVNSTEITIDSIDYTISVVDNENTESNEEIYNDPSQALNQDAMDKFMQELVEAQENYNPQLVEDTILSHYYDIMSYWNSTCPVLHETDVHVSEMNVLWSKVHDSEEYRELYTIIATLLNAEGYSKDYEVREIYLDHVDIVFVNPNPYIEVQIDSRQYICGLEGGIVYIKRVS